MASAVGFALAFAFVLDYLIGPSRALLFAPFRVVIFSLVVGYGIATRKILEVGFLHAAVDRLPPAGGLPDRPLLPGLVACEEVFVPVFGEDGRSLAHFLASLVIAFAMAPARGVSQSLADRLFIGTRRLDFQATMNQAAAILRSVTTLADLLERFGLTIAPGRRHGSSFYPPA